MPTPVTSVRVAPENRDILKRVVELINAGRADQLRRLLADLNQPPLGPFRSAEEATADAVCRIVAQLEPDVEAGCGAGEPSQGDNVDPGGRHLRQVVGPDAARGLG